MKIPQKTVRHTPAGKLYDAFLAVLSGAHGLSEINTALRSPVAAAEDVLSLDRWRRTRTVLRMDSGGGSLPDVSWCLARGYQLHCKDISAQRAAVWAATVVEWFDDPAHPERQVGWVVPEETPDYARPVRRLAIRRRKRNGQIGHDLLISTLAPDEVLRLLGSPPREAYEPELVALAYARLYDRRAGAIEVEIKEDKQGVGIARRRKGRAAAQAMLTLLGTRARNVPAWARGWLAAAEPRLKRYGIVRLLRDVLCVGGFVETDGRGAEAGAVLNRGSTLARLLAGGLRELLSEQSVAVSLGSLSD